MSDNSKLIPEYDEYLEKLFNLNPVGNAEQDFKLMCMKLGEILPTREILTFELLCKRYEDYLKYIKPFNEVKDKQYIKREMIMKNIGEYMLTNMYESDYSMKISNPNDSYLFGI